MNRKLGLLAAAAALGCLLAVGGTLAWFTDAKTATNTLTMGDVRIKINESTNEDVGSYTKTDAGIQFTGSYMPGRKLSKIPTVRNIGENDAWIRAKVVFTDTKDEIINFGAGVALPALDYTGEWINGTDGYYYYKNLLKKSSDTSALFNYVTIPDTWGNAQSNMIFRVVVKAEAIQSEHLGFTGPVSSANVKKLGELFGSNPVDSNTSETTDAASPAL